MSSITLPPEDRRPALPPPQFRLSTLLGVMAVVCAVAATMNWVGPIGAFALTLFVLAVLAHVSGSALGSRLRSNGDQPVDEFDRPLPPTREPRREIPRAPGPKRLVERQRLGILLTVLVASASGLSALGGAWWTFASAPNPTLPDVALAAFAFAVLGGIWGLIGGGFAVVGIGACREAMSSRHADSSSKK